ATPPQHRRRNNKKTPAQALRGGTTKQSMLCSGLLHSVRNDEQGMEVIFSEEACSVSQKQ
ncbi:MAG: hypothetical protein LBV26_03950, partial [Bacteroidales bacterium]|nr:hypothetical protein [Bacteroidales bacterium]